MGDYKRIMALGSWLDRFLTATMSPWDIEELVDDALKLLNIDHVRSDDDPVINAIMNILTGADMAKIAKHERKWLWGSICAPDIDITEYANMTDYSVSDRELMKMDIIATFDLPSVLTTELQMLQDSLNTPWEYVLSPTENGEDSSLRFLLEGYNNIREMLVAKGRKIVIVNRMAFPNSNQSGHWMGGADTNRSDLWVRFPALVSRIFITFLREGGRDYCALCKNCGKFILAARKGQRLYCDGRCRIAHKRMRDKMGEALPDS
jgi:hypothetical protein